MRASVSSSVDPGWHLSNLVLGALAVGGALGALRAQSTATAPSAVAQACEPLLRSAEAQGLRVGFLACQLDDGTVVAQHREMAPFVPASNQKLLTVAAVLHALGAEYRFRTGFALRAGTLVVRGGGDPNWLTGSDHDPQKVLRGVASALAAAGVSAIRGIELDLDRFSGPGRALDWPANQEHLDFCAPSAGLLLDGACWAVELVPRDAGTPASVRLAAPWVGYRLEGAITSTTDRKQGGRYRVDERGDTLRLAGGFWTRNQARIVRGACGDPAALFERALRAALTAEGIAVERRAPALDRELPTYTTPLQPAIERALRDSSNIDAEQLLRVLGAEQDGDGSFVGAAKSFTRELGALVGDLPAGTRLVDGSGLSRANRVSPRLIVDTLRAMSASEHAATFVGALAKAGVDGTLERRFRGSGLEGRVRAKTGTLAGVSALSGYLAREAGAVIVFAILVDRTDAARGAIDARQLQEQLVAHLDGGGE